LQHASNGRGEIGCREREGRGRKKETKRKKKRAISFSFSSEKMTGRREKREKKKGKDEGDSQFSSPPGEKERKEGQDTTCYLCRRARRMGEVTSQRKGREEKRFLSGAQVPAEEEKKGGGGRPRGHSPACRARARGKGAGEWAEKKRGKEKGGEGSHSYLFKSLTQVQSKKGARILSSYPAAEKGGGRKRKQVLRKEGEKEGLRCPFRKREGGKKRVYTFKRGEKRKREGGDTAPLLEKKRRENSSHLSLTMTEKVQKGGRRGRPSSSIRLSRGKKRGRKAPDTDGSFGRKKGEKNTERGKKEG